MSQVDEEQWYDVSPQEAYAEAERRIAEAEDSGAKHLDLGDLPLYELPPSLSRLQSLEMLALGSWKIGRDSDWEFRSFRPAFQGSDLSPLASLKSLQSLNLKFCESVSDLSPLTELTSLRSLNLGSCSSSDLRPLAGLTSLQSLDLSDCIAVTDLTPLAGLFSLRSLNLSDCIAVSDVTPLAALTSLQSLQLKECMELSDLTPLAGLSSLQSLDVNHCRRVSDLRPLSGLSLLKSLRLDTCSKVSDLTPLVGLSSLHFLELSACKSVSDLTPLVELSSLRSLELKYCGVLRFSPVRHLLDQLDHLVLFGTKFEDLPVELTGGEMFENVIKNVRAHFTDLQAGESDEAEVKVFILGNGRVGKTQLVRSLLDIDFDEDVPSTHGVQCKHRIEHKLAGWNRVRLNFWDFGGQDIYHATHTLFLHGESVFLLLWSPKHESGVFDEGGLTIRNRPLAYWLDYVFTLAGPDVPVLVIQSQCDERPMQQSPQIPIDHDFEYLRPFQFSAKTRLGLEELKGQLRSAVECVLGRFPKRSTIGIGRAKVRNMLRDLLEKDQERAPCDRIHRTLTRAQFDDMCEELNRKQPASISNPSALLDFLHQSGVVYYRPSYFGGQILLDQEWALEAIYTLFYRKEVLPHLKECDGRFTRPLLDSLIWGRQVDGKGPYSRNEQWAFLVLMQNCGICFRTNRYLDDNAIPLEGKYLAPELLPDWRTIREHNFAWTERVAADMTATVSYRFLHEGIFRGLLSKFGRIAGERAKYARQGFGFHDSETGCDVVIEAVDQETAAQPGAGEVRFRAWGENAAALIEWLVRLVPRMTIQPPEIRISRKCEQTIAKVEDPKGIEIKVDRSEAQTLGPSKGRVYISYAWGEETDLRQQAAEEFVRRIDEWGYEAVFDARAIRPGDLISKFMHEIARGGKVVVILSDRYLRSRYCMNELNLSYLNVGRDNPDFAAKIIPIVLEDAKINSPLDRAHHAVRWAEEYNKLAEMEDYLGFEDRKLLDSYSEWSKHIGDILATISDKLSIPPVADLDRVDWDFVRKLIDR